eukprot:697030_1
MQTEFQKSISAFIYAACQPKMPSLTITSGIGAANSRCGVYLTNHVNQSDSIKLREYRVDGAFMMVNNRGVPLELSSDFPTVTRKHIFETTTATPADISAL